MRRGRDFSEISRRRRFSTMQARKATWYVGRGTGVSGGLTVPLARHTSWRVSVEDDETTDGIRYRGDAERD